MINIIKFKKYCFILVVILISCHSYNKSEKLQLSQNIFTGKAKFSIVFYHNGECSYCYGVLAELNASFPKVSVISITTLKDTNLLNFQLKQISFKGLSIIDSSGMFYNNNQKMLYSSNLFLINQQNEILQSFFDYDIETKESLNKFIYE